MKDTPIGRGLSERMLIPAACVGAAAVALDSWFVWLNRYPESCDGRWAIALVAPALLIRLAGGNGAAVGLAAPAYGWKAWAGWSVVLGLVAGVCMAAAAGVWVATGHALPVNRLDPTDVVPAFLHMCLFAPLLEEATYRVTVCAPVAALAGPRAAIAVSGIAFGSLHAEGLLRVHGRLVIAVIGIAFGSLHVLYGNASPENLLGGFFLAWAYVRSGSVAVPIALHAAGNAVMLAGQIAAWHWL